MKFEERDLLADATKAYTRTARELSRLVANAGRVPPEDREPQFRALLEEHQAAGEWYRDMLGRLGFPVPPG